MLILPAFMYRSGAGVLILKYLGDRFCRLPKITASLKSGLGEEVFDQAHADIVAHLVELLVDLTVLVVEIGA